MSYSENNRVIIDLDLCAQIAACAAACPQDALKFMDNIPQFLKDCEGPCRICADSCATDAVRIK